MEIVLGPFHPHLEDALVDAILNDKQPDPLGPLLIVVPSDALRRRLKVLLVRERQLKLLNVQILTFYQLSLKLYERHYRRRPESLRDDLYLEEALRQFLRTHGSAIESFSGLEEKVGGCAALWQTFRDLKDGMINPAQTLEAACEGYFGPEDSRRVSDLIRLYQEFLESCAARLIQDLSDLDAWAAEQAASSSVLEEFKRICYYGFYDLTQVQLDVFHAVARRFPTTLFFPLVAAHPAWEFAQRFYERHLRGLAENSQIRNLVDENGAAKCASPRNPLTLFVEGAPKQSAPPGWQCTIISCSAPHDEMVLTAKEILRLVDQERFSFSEIGVVARSLEPYQPWIREVFSQHLIPIQTAAVEPLRQFPLVKAVLLLVHLAAHDYPRSQLMDLVASPFFNLRLFGSSLGSPRPDLWDVLTRKLGITKGRDEWRRLERFLQTETQVAANDGTEDEPKTLRVPAAQIRMLWELFRALHADLSSLPEEDSWSGYVSAWKALVQKYLTAEAPQAGPRDEKVRAKVLHTLEGMAALDAVAPRISLSQFAAAFERWLDSAATPMTDAKGDGVSVLDAMSARGIPFRVLFLIGMNEGTFPRTIREDAFLRDRSRRVFAQVLGCKVSEKLGAFDEEKLLFAVLVEAARERLYCLYQRSDETGRALTRSWYVDELIRAAGEAAAPELVIPRGLDQKRAFEPFRRSEYFLPHELAIHLNLRGEDPSPVVEGFFAAPALYRAGHRIMETLEDSSAGLGAFDGVMPPMSDYWERLKTRGVSPTPLETYARCPFQFFASQILRLDRLEDPEALGGIQPAEAGTIVHLILKNFYDEAARRGSLTSQQPPLDPQQLLRRVAEQVFREYERDNPVGYAVAWEIFREDITELLTLCIRQDLERQRRDGYRPIALEKEFVTRLDPRWEPLLANFPIQGKLDRIDFMAAENRYRVIDYKFKTTPNPSPMDRNLPLAAIRGQRLQPPFYVLLARELSAAQPRRQPLPEVEASFYFIAPGWRAGPLVTTEFGPEAWEGGLGKQLRQTLALLLDGIRNGRFFIQPGNYCRYCVVSEACRKNHLPTRWRAEGDPQTEPYRELARKKLLRGDADDEDPLA